MGAKFFQKCLVCLLITFVILLVYIALRFKKIGGLSAGVTALIALVHDVLLVYFAFVIFGFSINDIFHRRYPDNPRLLAERYHRHLRPYS